jgi:hypothetical protein
MENAPKRKDPWWYTLSCWGSSVEKRIVADLHQLGIALINIIAPAFQQLGQDIFDFLRNISNSIVEFFKNLKQAVKNTPERVRNMMLSFDSATHKEKSPAVPSQNADDANTPDDRKQGFGPKPETFLKFVASFVIVSLLLAACCVFGPHVAQPARQGYNALAQVSHSAKVTAYDSAGYMRDFEYKQNLKSALEPVQSFAQSFVVDPAYSLATEAISSIRWRLGVQNGSRIYKQVPVSKSTESLTSSAESLIPTMTSVLAETLAQASATANSLFSEEPLLTISSTSTRTKTRTVYHVPTEPSSPLEFSAPVVSSDGKEEDNELYTVEKLTCNEYALDPWNSLSNELTKLDSFIHCS